MCVDASEIPLAPPEQSVQVTEEVEDTRMGFFQHVVLEVSWRAPEGKNRIWPLYNIPNTWSLYYPCVCCVVDVYLDSFRVDLENLDESEERCGTNRSLHVEYVMNH